MKRWLTFCVTSLFFWLSPYSFAAMSLDRMVVYFDDVRTTSQDIIVSNPDDETLYLETEVYKVVNPGRENEERIRVINPDEIKLLSTPKKAIIPPNSRKTIRLVSLETPKNLEEVYRITFRPVIGDLTATKTAIKLLIAYQALVFIRPENPKYNVTAQRDGRRITFTNSGNMNVVLRNGKFCNGKVNEANCSDIEEGNRLYAGQSWTLELPDKTTNVEYGLFNGRTEERKTF